MDQTGDQNTYGRNHIGEGARVASAVQIAGDHYGGLDLRSPAPAPDPGPAAATPRERAVDLLWHLARVDPGKREEAMAVIEALEGESAPSGGFTS